ncbi:NAD-dependent epimerase/dehydratase family protein [Streptomyces sp. TRM68416]|uniref:NAD-dependent epimerase/dehydratase family protein n=1 Tax=Streptomyces sp. TRM68416 TaxID=2758412 RepID=UPI001661FFF0|nr:NAD-dependent epimerase/dehydratase family protein [Streptomyces sp. TRM68416]MBD0839924.1 hypothetical protein [Streptomyces sp. TRM68416]
MRILILGGTGLLGRPLVENAVRDGWEVTTFNRGLTGPDHPEVKALRGDRDAEDGLAALRSGRWDAVIDTSGLLPSSVERSTRLLADRAGLYLFVSSLAALTWPQQPVTDELPVRACPLDASMADTGYGTLKAGCEHAVGAVPGARALVVRPGLISGPGDGCGPLGRWLRRAARGGRILAGGDPRDPVQLLDCRDVASWLLACARDGRTGVLNAAGPAGAMTMGDLLETCVTVTGAKGRLVWADDEFLVAAGVRAWVDLPLWEPRSTAGHGNRWTVRTAAAYAAGLSCRPYAETVEATWKELGDGTPEESGVFGPLTPEKERALIDAWLNGARVPTP